MFPIENGSEHDTSAAMLTLLYPECTKERGYMRLLIAFFALAAFAVADNEPLLLQKPTLSKTHIVFAYAGDLWSVAREGGDAARLTSGTGTETDPSFSPDGSQIAFPAEYAGNTNSFVVPAPGAFPSDSRGTPRPIASSA